MCTACLKTIQSTAILSVMRMDRMFACQVGTIRQTVQIIVFLVMMTTAIIFVRQMGLESVEKVGMQSLTVQSIVSQKTTKLTGTMIALLMDHVFACPGGTINHTVMFHVFQKMTKSVDTTTAPEKASVYARTTGIFFRIAQNFANKKPVWLEITFVQLMALEFAIKTGTAFQTVPISAGHVMILLVITPVPLMVQ